MLETYRKRCNQLLEKYLSSEDDTLHEAMRYSVLAGGKRIRPLLVYAAGDAVNADKEKCDNAAIAVELIHAYSLIHDDLPAMDDAGLRHGKLACHKKFGEAMAILAGDGLQSAAIHTLLKNNNIRQVQTLAYAMGAMVSGQSLDLEAGESVTAIEELQAIHARKTGALIIVSVQLGALCGEVNRDLLMSMTLFGQALGLAFQIQDDILDRVASTEKLGKTAGLDDKKQKATYVTLLGLAGAKKELKKACQKAAFYLDTIPNAKALREVFDFIINRDC